MLMKEKRNAWIYALVDPRNKAIRYIGKAVDLKKRLAQHLSPSSLKKHTHKNFWIKKLLALGLKPEIEPIADLHYLDDWAEEERLWIARLRSLSGHPKLTNSTDGGEGVEGLVFSEESRKKMSQSGKGRRASAETCARISAAHKGKVKTPEHCKNLSIGQKKRYDHLSPKERHKGWKNRIVLNRTSQYLGVAKKKGEKNKNKPWSAFFVLNGNHTYIGLFATEQESAYARDIFVIANIGLDYPLNFPVSSYEGLDIEKEIEKFGKYKKNTSGYRGVSFRKSENVWLCFVSQNNKSICLGYFPGTEKGKIEAAHTYDRWVIQHRGPLAYTNFPRDSYD